MIGQSLTELPIVSGINKKMVKKDKADEKEVSLSKKLEETAEKEKIAE
jgi:hypothetical protein